MAELHDPADRVTGLGRRGELGCQGELLGRGGLQREDRLDDDAEAALGADEEPGQVVPRDALGGTAAGTEQPPVGEHHLQAEYVLGGHSVLHAAQAARRGADVPADGAGLPAGGVRRVVEPLFGDGPGQHGVDDARFDDRDPVDGADLQDPVHLHEGQHDAAVTGVGRAGEPGTRALRDDGRTEGGRGPHDVLDLLGGARQHHGGGGPGLAESGHVSGVRGHDVGVGDQSFGRKSGAQPFEQIVHDPSVTPGRGGGKGRAASADAGGGASHCADAPPLRRPPPRFSGAPP